MDEELNIKAPAYSRTSPPAAASWRSSQKGGRTTRQPRTPKDSDLPDYLSRYYAWAYMWPVSVRLLDRHTLINSALFGHYGQLRDKACQLIDPPTAGSTLQISSAYGNLTPTLAREIDDLHVAEVAPIQIENLERKMAVAGQTAQVRRMNAEHLGYETHRFDTALVFMLLHELPPQARCNVLREALRVLRPGGRLVIAEYGEIKDWHRLHRFAPFRWIVQTWEPFLKGLWHENLTDTLSQCAAHENMSIRLLEQARIFGGFYSVTAYQVLPLS